jgi:hypothetical protein
MHCPDAAANFPIRRWHLGDVSVDQAGFKMVFEEKPRRSRSMCFEIVAGEGRINR